MLKAAVDLFETCVYTQDFVVCGSLPLPPRLDTAKMLNRADRTCLTLVDALMIQHDAYYDALLKQTRQGSEMSPETIKAQQDASMLSPMTLGATPSPVSPAVPDTPVSPPESADARTPQAQSDEIIIKDTIDESLGLTDHEPLNMFSIPKERIVWMQGGRVDEPISGPVAQRTVYFLYTNYVIYGEMQLAPQMRFSDHLSNTIASHAFQSLRNVKLANIADSHDLSAAPVVATYDFLTVNLHCIGGAFELGNA
ncbi:MAG: hypothetical protein AAF267_00415 [Deinococcota bacterium]